MDVLQPCILRELASDRSAHQLAVEGGAEEVPSPLLPVVDHHLPDDAFLLIGAKDALLQGGGVLVGTASSREDDHVVLVSGAELGNGSGMASVDDVLRETEVYLRTRLKGNQAREKKRRLIIMYTEQSIRSGGWNRSRVLYEEENRVSHLKMKDNLKFLRAGRLRFGPVHNGRCSYKT